MAMTVVPVTESIQLTLPMSIRMPLSKLVLVRLETISASSTLAVSLEVHVQVEVDVNATLARFLVDPAVAPMHV